LRDPIQPAIAIERGRVIVVANLDRGLAYAAEVERAGIDSIDRDLRDSNWQRGAGM
jgi:hypothetical protein